MQAYLAWLKRGDARADERMRGRYIGSLVSDVHRNLLTGGVYAYPASVLHPEGRLRLLYEANPMAFLVEQAGGAASDGSQRILDIEPKRLHQRTGLFIGTTELVEAADAFLAGHPERVPDAPPAA